MNKTLVKILSKTFLSRTFPATRKISLACKMLTLKKKAWDLLGYPGIVLMLLQDFDCHMSTESATHVHGTERDYSQHLIRFFVG